MMRRFALAFALLVLPLAALADALPAPHLQLNIALDPATRALSATADLGAHSATLQLALAPGLRVSRLIVDGRARDLPAVVDGRIDLALGSPGPHRIQLNYGGQLAPLPELDHRGVLARLPPMADTRGSYLPAGS
ncbi:MAG: family peptidase, partial [Proteobacteria bacterium]|nr:family peptidase [Pseudomonadota bacterium]